MLLDTFFQIAQMDTIAPQHFRVVVSLVPNHPVYAGHFPANPVAPGVCTLQMIVECAGRALGYSVMITQAPVIKFLEVVRPSINKNLEIDLQMDDELTMKTTVKSGERMVISCKLKLKKDFF